MATTIVLQNVRLSFPRLFSPEAGPNGGEAKYSAQFLIRKSDTASIETLNKALEAVAREKWGDKAPTMLETLKRNNMVCMRDGDLKGTAEHADHFYMNASNRQAPAVVGRSLEKLDETTPLMYGGCYVNAKLQIWAQSNAYGKRINASLLGVQFVQHGEAFGSGASQTTAEGFKALDVAPQAEGFQDLMGDVQY